MTTNLNGTHYLDNENESKISESISQTDPQILKPNHIIKLLKSPSRQKDVRNVFLHFCRCRSKSSIGFNEHAERVSHRYFG